MTVAVDPQGSQRTCVREGIPNACQEIIRYTLVGGLQVRRNISVLYQISTGSIAQQRYIEVRSMLERCQCTDGVYAPDEPTQLTEVLRPVGR